MPDKRYELFGWDYEHHCPLSQKEIDWYVSYAKKTGGPVLELACGTGRLLIEIAKHGFQCDGIDLSQTMLAIAKDHILRLPPEIASLVALHNVDMTDFQFENEFSLIVIADNSFRELTTRVQQLSCLRCVNKHLQRGGTLLVTVRRFEPSRYSNGHRKFDWSAPLYHPTTNEEVTRRGEIKLVENGKRIVGAFFYRIIHKNGRETIEKCCFEAPVMLKGDYLTLFSEAGFSTYVFVDYEEREEDSKNPILCFVCEKKQL